MPAAELREAVVVATFPSDAAAAVAGASLQAAGIDHRLLSDDGGGTYGSLRLVHGVRLAVSAADAEVARELLRVLLDAPAERGARRAAGEARVHWREPRRPTLARVALWLLTIAAGAAIAISLLIAPETV